MNIVPFYEKIHVTFFHGIAIKPLRFWIYKQHNRHCYKVALEITNSISPERVSLIRKKWPFLLAFLLLGLTYILYGKCTKACPMNHNNSNNVCFLPQNAEKWGKKVQYIPNKHFQARFFKCTVNFSWFV